MIADSTKHRSCRRTTRDRGSELLDLHGSAAQSLQKTATQSPVGSLPKKSRIRFSCRYCEENRFLQQIQITHYCVRNRHS